MTGSIRKISACLIIIVLYVFCAFHMQKARDQFSRSSFVNYALPSKLIGPMSLEFKGMASDFLLLKLMTFIGGELRELRGSSEDHYKYIKGALHTITDLDPYFWDAYIFAETILAWDARDFAGANDLLLKARKHLPNDYRPPYYIGFNHFYFLKDNKAGAEFFMEASMLPGRPSFLPSLATRLSVRDSDYQAGILFLKQMLKNTQNRVLIKRYTKRIQALESHQMLEMMVFHYVKKYGSKPPSLEALVKSGMISQIPEDPYGGEFVLKEDGRVYTTSNMRERK
ncbi:MAG: hypothetical protein SV686_17580 [Thermodesulfobacteriota bacterium]|nr:hypothetical protein [Thermodesulfobacteriota bacterium]